ncbi:MAG: hypothetical protein K9N21_18510 [Deltaproteobacteria bacterium]|nr:hypothetical protein [Deltaproteobacteria bacterium]
MNGADFERKGHAAKEIQKKPTTSKKKLRRQARRIEPRDLMEKVLKEKPRFAGKLIRNPPGRKKMSEVILKYAAPLMEHAENVEQQHKAIAMAIICWNASLLTGEDRGRILAEAFAGTGIWRTPALRKCWNSC